MYSLQQDSHGNRIVCKDMRAARITGLSTVAITEPVSATKLCRVARM